GQHVARPQPVQDVFIARRRFVDVAHQGQAELLSRLQCDVEWGNTGRSARIAADTHLDTYDRVAMVVGHSYSIGRAHQSQVAAFADHDAFGEREYAGKRDVQVSENARLARFDDVFEKTAKVARA